MAAIEQEPAATGYVHAPVASVQVSVVHESASMHVVLVAQLPEPPHMPQPATDPSSQRTPVRGDHDVVLTPEAQSWQSLAGLMVLVA